MVSFAVVARTPSQPGYPNEPIWMSGSIISGRFRRLRVRRQLHPAEVT